MLIHNSGLALLASILIVSGCSCKQGRVANASGGAGGSGGQNFGGAPTGGSSSSSNGSGGSSGAIASGGVATSGGTTGSGSKGSTGGATSVGGTTTGTGGAANTGGSKAAGGATSSGGATGGGGSTTKCGNGTAAASDIVVDLSQPLQTMDGFGISNAYQDSAISDSVADQFFDKSKGIGLSIFRLGIDSSGNSMGPWSDAQKAAARGAIVWGAPWSPPASCKSNGSESNGGHLNPSCYDSWATTIANFVAKAKQNNITIMGLSVQNEADNSTPYESCLYTNAEMVAFIKVLGPKIQALSPPVKLIAPESTRWEDLWGGTPNKGDYSFGTAILADSAAAGLVDILATHMYETQKALAPPAGLTKPIWQTEMSGVPDSPEEGPSSDIANGIVWAKWIHEAFVVGGASAWHAWWISSLNNDNEGLLLQDGGTTKRLYTVGNYSKFIRPGYRRVTISGTLPPYVLLTAYKNSSDGTVVIVAINSGTAAAAASLFISGGAPCQMTPWVTSSSDDLAAKTALLVTDGRLFATLGAQTVTTFVGIPNQR